MLSGSLYYHFKSKDAIIDEILRAFLDPLFAEYRTAVTADSSPRRMLEALVMASFRAIAANRWAVEIYQKEGRWLSTNPEFSYIKDRNREFREIWMGVFESGLVQGWFRSDIDADQYFRFVRDSVWLSARWFGDDDGEKFREVGRMYLTMILDGLVIRR
ncbi:HTH-type transcriptional repressor KstR2 (plasmid) [Rhodococcus ruber]